MADEEKKVIETPKEEPKEEGYDYAKDHNRPIAVIIKEPVIATPEKKEEKPEKEEAAPEKKEEPISNPLDEAKKYLEEQRKKDTLEAERVARETTEKTIKERDESTKREAKEQDELKPIWEREGREPKDYTEIAAENRRIVKLEVLREQRTETERLKAEESTKTQQQQQESTKQLESIQSRIMQDMEELYSGGYMTRPVKAGDPNDLGEKQKAALFELGVKINEERRAAGKPTEPSIAKIFFMNQDKLKPVAPAGGDAPVSGSTTTTPPKVDEGYDYKRDHNKSLRQLAMEEARRS